MEQITLRFTASGQKLTSDDCPYHLASNTVNYVRAAFDLDDTWQAFDAVRAEWSTNRHTISTVLDFNGECAVPHEVLEKLKKVSVNLVGSVSDNEVLTDRLTTYPLEAVIVDAEAFVDGDNTAEVTPSEFDQYVQAVEDAVADIRDVDTVTLNDDYTLTFTFSSGDPVTVGPIRGAQGERGPEGPEGPQGEPGEVTLAQLESVLPTDTASGAIASFPDGSDLFDYLSCIVDIDPVQDLHGYDKPWVGGAGVNKFNKDATNTSNGYVSGRYVQYDGQEAVSPSYNISEYTAIEQNTQYTLSSLSGYSPSICFYDGSKNFISGVKYNGEPNITFTTPNNATLCRISIPSANVDTVQLEKGSTVTTYSPYANICPITGWTGCEVVKAGVNLIDEANTTLYRRYFQDLGERHVWTSDAGSGSFAFVCKPNTTYTVSCDNSSIALFRVGYIDVDPDALASSDSPTLYGVVKKTASGSTTITTGADAKAVIVQINNAIATARTAKLQIELGSTASSYSAYTGTTYPVSWQTEAGTVYGGTVDVVTGVLTVTHKSTDLTDDMTGGTVGQGYCYYKQVPDAQTVPNGQVADIIAEAYEAIRFNAVSATVGTIAIRDNGYLYVNTGGQGILPTGKAVYALAQPQTYQLTPTQVHALLGQNNVWADCGDTSVTYKADVQRWVEKKLAE